jgi:hypothetical protein
VAEVGDFRVGQGVALSKCNIHFTNATLWGPRSSYGSFHPLRDAITLRGYDGGAGPWTVYILDVTGTGPFTFRWSDDLGRTWKQTDVPITYDWQELSGGTEIRFNKRNWEAGYTVTFAARDQLVTIIDNIDGNVLTLRDAPTAAVSDVVLRHSDTLALQRVIDRAIRERRNLVPRCL